MNKYEVTVGYLPDGEGKFLPGLAMKEDGAIVHNLVSLTAVSDPRLAELESARILFSIASVDLDETGVTKILKNINDYHDLKDGAQ